MKRIYPLEGISELDARYMIYDGVGRKVWGELRIVRSSQPDVLEVQVAKGDLALSSRFTPILLLTAVGEHLALRPMNQSSPAEPEKGIIL